MVGGCLDVQDSSYSRLIHGLDVHVGLGVGSKGDSSFSDPSEEKVSNEITICLGAITIDNKHSIRIVPNARALGSKLASVPRRILDVEEPLWLPLPHQLSLHIIFLAE